MILLFLISNWYSSFQSIPHPSSFEKTRKTDKETKQTVRTPTLSALWCDKALNSADHFTEWPVINDGSRETKTRATIHGPGATAHRHTAQTRLF